MRRCIATLAAIVIAGCGASSGAKPDAPKPELGSNPVASACTGSLVDYCSTTTTGCPSYDQSVVQHKLRCTAGGTWTVQSRSCAGVYRSVAWNEVVLGGGEEYFAADGRLLGARLETDYRAFCAGTSFSQSFGSVPTCPGQPISTDLCAR
jgi:hypothetical protein